MIIIREATEKNIPYDLVSSLAILRDYNVIEDSDYVNEEHKLLVDIADSLFNVGASVANNFKAEYKEVYDKYGKSYFNKVLKDMRALDSQIGSGNVNDLIDEINDKLAAFGGIDESYMIREQDVEIEVKHEGILEVPEGKNVDDLPVSHFEKLAKKKGLGKITKALNNLQVWNKNDDTKLSKWAGDMIDKLNKKLKKDESFVRLYEQDEYGNVTDALLNLGFEADRTGKWSKYYPKDSFWVLIIPETGDCYISMNASSMEIDSRLKPVNTPESVSEIDRIANISWTKLSEPMDQYVSRMKKDNDFVNGVWIRKNAGKRESVSRKRSKNIKESGEKSYWSYDLMDIDDNKYYDKRSIRRIKLIPCDNPDDCYADFGGTTSWAVCDTDYGNEVFCTKDQAYSYLLDTINRNRYEREHDI